MECSVIPFGGGILALAYDVRLASKRITKRMAEGRDDFRYLPSLLKQLGARQIIWCGWILSKKWYMLKQLIKEVVCVEEKYQKKDNQYFVVHRNAHCNFVCRSGDGVRWDAYRKPDRFLWIHTGGCRWRRRRQYRGRFKDSKLAEQKARAYEQSASGGRYWREWEGRGRGRSQYPEV